MLQVASVAVEKFPVQTSHWIQVMCFDSLHERNVRFILETYKNNKLCETYKTYLKPYATAVRIFKLFQCIY